MPPLVQNNMLVLPVGSAPATPDPAELGFYVDANGIIHQKDDLGVDTVLSSALGYQDLNGVDYGFDPVTRFTRGARVDLGSNDVELQVIPRQPQRRWLVGVPITPTPGYRLLSGYTVTETTNGGAAVDELKNKRPTRRYTSNAVAADAAGWSSTLSFRAQYSPLFSVWIHTGASIAAQRLWAGLFSAAPGNVDALGAVAGVGFNYSSVLGGSLSGFTSNAVTTTRTTLLTLAADTSYLLTCWFFGSAAFWQVNGGTIFTSAVTPPAAATVLGYFVRAVNTTTSSNTLNIGAMYAENN